MQVLSRSTGGKVQSKKSMRVIAQRRKSIRLDCPKKKPLANRREAYGRYESCSTLLAHGRRHVGFTSLLLQILQLLLRIVELLLLVRNLLLELRVFFIPRTGVAQSIAGVRIKGGCAQTVLAIGQ